MEEQRRAQAEAQAQQSSYQHAEAQSITAESNDGSAEAEEPAEAAQPFVREDRKVGRNEVCPCGSGKKYKQCHGKLTA